MVVIGFTLTFALLFLGLHYVLPMVVRRATAAYYLHCLFVVWGTFNLVSRYILAVFTNPGTDTSSSYKRLVEDWRRRCEAREEDRRRKSARRRDAATRDKKNVEEEREGPPPPLMSWTMCPKTNLPKPPRAHFDSVTRQLVLNFDHFCPWLFNAVGFQNYRHFVAFLFWVWVLTLYASLVSVNALPALGPRTPWDERAAVIFVFLCCYLLSVAVGGGLLSWHLYLSVSGETAIDHLVLASRREYQAEETIDNPFDFGSPAENLRHALFSSPPRGGGRGISGMFELFLPPLPSSLPYGDPYPFASSVY